MQSIYSSSQSKTAIQLEDFDWKKDVYFRQFLIGLNSKELEVLGEVLDNSVHFTVSSIDLDPKVALPVLTKFAAAGLLTLEGRNVQVNKELRKYFELQIERAESDFSPNIRFAFSLLKQTVPLHLLPSWYALSKSADLLWEGLTKQFFETPITYRKYLQNLELDHPVAQQILTEFRNSGYKELSLAAFSCTPEELEKALLLLEFHFVCFAGIEEGTWVLKPLHEWSLYMDKCATLTPRSLSEERVEGASAPFAFVEAMALALEEGRADSMLGDKLSELGFEAGAVEAEEWLAHSLEDRAILLYRHPYNSLSRAHQYKGLTKDVSIRLTEKSLRTVADAGWVLFEEFFQGFVQPIGSSEGVVLEGSGRKRAFAFPQYSELEKQFVQDVIFERLFQAGVVRIGQFEGNPCFCLTEFGKGII